MSLWGLKKRITLEEHRRRCGLSPRYPCSIAHRMCSAALAAIRCHALHVHRTEWRSGSTISVYTSVTHLLLQVRCCDWTTSISHYPPVPECRLPLLHEPEVCLALCAAYYAVLFNAEPCARVRSRWPYHVRTGAYTEPVSDTRSGRSHDFFLLACLLTVH